MPLGIRLHCLLRSFDIYCILLEIDTLLGSVGWALIIWALCGVLSTIGALCYAELGTTFTKSGGDYIFLLENFGPLPAFLRIWTSIVAVRTASPVVLALTSATYMLIPFFPDCSDPPSNAVKLIASLLLGK